MGTCDYEPFGEVSPGTVCSLPVNYRFAGMEWDPETSLYQTRFRKYDVNQGRWMSVDPLAGSADNPQSLDRYVYVLNDPVNLVDLLGLCHESAPPSPPSAPPPGCRWDCQCVYAGGPDTGWTCQWDCSGANPGNVPGCVIPGTSISVPCGDSFGPVPLGMETIPERLLQLWEKIAEIWDTLRNIPLSGTAVITPAAFSVAYIQQTGQVCMGGGAGVAFPPVRVAASGGLAGGNINNAEAIFSGWAYSSSANTSPFIGSQASWNSSGALGGPAVGTPGGSISYTYSRCFSLR